MRAAAIDHFGGPEAIRVERLTVPEPQPGEVLIRVESAGVGEWDPFEREGGFAKLMGTTPVFPYVLGSDGAGTVVAVGRGVTRFKEGDRVYGLSLGTSKGFYAEYAPVKAEHASHVPRKVPTDQAGVMPADALTALRGLEALKLKPGSTLAVFGASGGIGHLAVQLAKRMGARVLAIASGDDGVRLARRLGADAVVDGHAGDVAAACREFAPNGLDAALLTAGGKEAQQTCDAVRDGGGVAHPHGVEPEPRGMSGVTVTAYDADPDPEAIERLNRWIEAGPFEVHVFRTFPLDQAAEAHRAVHGHHLGKLALKPATVRRPRRSSRLLGERRQGRGRRGRSPRRSGR
jgi:NADPH:quinone reductase-like Zn-dependent oxidoreductase